MHCLFDSTYATRLWCVFEMAVFLKMRKTPNLIFSSMSQGVLQISVMVLIISFRALVDGIDALTNANIQLEEGDTQALQAKSNEESLTAYKITSILCWSVNLICICIVFIFGRMHFQAVTELRQSLTNFDVSEAQIFVESDREFLLEILNDLFKDRNSQQELTDGTQTVLEAEPAQSQGIGNQGLQKLNELLRFHIPKQLPTRGLRSWKLFGYVAAVITFGYQDVVWFYDLWGWHHPDAYIQFTKNARKNSFYHEVWGKLYPFVNFWSVVGFVWQFFVLTPFSVFLLCAEVRFLVWLHKKSGWPNWTAYAVFLPILIVLESILGLRLLFTNVNVGAVMWWLLQPYDIENIGWVVVNGEYIYNQRDITKTVFRYAPIAGLDWLWLFDIQDNGDSPVSYWWCVPKPIPESKGFGAKWADVQPPPVYILGWTAWFPTNAGLKVLLKKKFIKNFNKLIPKSSKLIEIVSSFLSENVA
jgi:hypothetical protein